LDLADPAVVRVGDEQVPRAVEGEGRDAEKERRRRGAAVAGEAARGAAGDGADDAGDRVYPAGAVEVRDGEGAGGVAGEALVVEELRRGGRRTVARGALNAAPRCDRHQRGRGIDPQHAMAVDFADVDVSRRVDGEASDCAEGPRDGGDDTGRHG